MSSKSRTKTTLCLPMRNVYLGYKLFWYQANLYPSTFSFEFKSLKISSRIMQKWGGRMRRLISNKCPVQRSTKPSSPSLPTAFQSACAMPHPYSTSSWAQDTTPQVLQEWCRTMQRIYPVTYPIDQIPWPKNLQRIATRTILNAKLEGQYILGVKQWNMAHQSPIGGCVEC